MNKIQGNGSSPTKKWSGLLEKTEKKKEIELQIKALVALAKTEHEIGKIFLDFFIACFNLIIYHRGLHSKSFFAIRECRRFGLQIPYMRFPETIVYLEKVTEKGVNCLMADLLEGFIFEERDRFGNTIMFMFKLHGSARITSTTLMFTADILKELTESCGELLHELIRTLTSIPPIMQPNMFRWKVELGLKKVDKQDSKWDINKQGIFDDDPDWKIFPWLRNVRGSRRRDSFQEVENSGSTVSTESATVADQNPVTKADEVSEACVESKNEVQKANAEEPVDEDFFDTNNFHDVTLEEDMGSPVLTNYEKEDLSLIEYEEENQPQEGNNDHIEERPGSPDMFADSPQSQTLSPTTSVTIESSPISYHMENLDSIQSISKDHDSPKSQESESYHISNQSSSMCIERDPVNGPLLENNRMIFTQANTDSPPLVVLDSSAKLKNDRDKSLSPDQYQDVTTIYEDFEDFDDLDKVLELVDSDDAEMSGNDLDMLNSSLTNPEPAKGVKFYCAATSKMLDTLVCNILIFKDTNADELHSDYKPHVAKKKMKRTVDNESS